MATTATSIEVQGREIRVTNPDKVYFPDAEGGPITKLEVVEYWAAVADAALHGCRDRPEILHRFPAGVADDGEGSFYQKRIPNGAPDWVLTATVMFPSGRTAAMPVMADEAALVWAATLGCLECNPWPVRADDVARPDELRVDLDPTPGVPWDDVRRVALTSREVLAEHGLTGFPKTSGKRGLHINARVERGNGFTATRRAALAFAREVERRMPGIATTAWWKEERQGVFLDYNQNARDRTVASAYSIRPTARRARVDAAGLGGGGRRRPVTVHGSHGARPVAGTRRSGCSHRPTRGHARRVAGARRAGRRRRPGRCPWPPHFPKGDDEPVRAATPHERRNRPNGRR